VTRLNEIGTADWRNQNVALFFQTFNLIPVLTAFETWNCRFLLTRLSGRERRKLVLTALELVALADRARHCRNKLSAARNSARPLPARW